MVVTSAKRSKRPAGIVVPAELPEPPAIRPVTIRPAAFEGMPAVFGTFCEKMPLTVMVRALLEWMLEPEALQRIFREAAPEQHTRKFTLATLVRLMLQVSAGVRASLFAAFTADPECEGSAAALYAKLGRLDPHVGEALVRFSARKFAPLSSRFPQAAAEPVPGFVTHVVDGNVPTGTEHRLKPLRRLASACLPCKCLAVYRPGLGLITDMVAWEDAYTQERALVLLVLKRVLPGELWLGDRNFCTARFLFGVADAKAAFLVREHASSLSWTPAGELRYCGDADNGTVWEQPVVLRDPDTGLTMPARRVELRLNKPTQGGEPVIAFVTNLPDTVSAVTVAQVYRTRWTIEGAFQYLTQELNCEVPGLGRPRAALFALSMSMVASNALAVVRGALRAAHGVDVEREISGHYTADSVAGTYRTLDLLLPQEHWNACTRLSEKEMTDLLIGLAAATDLRPLRRHVRGPKKPHSQKRVSGKKHKHRSTARLLKEDMDKSKY